MQDKNRFKLSTVLAVLFLLSVVIFGGFQLLKPTFSSDEIENAEGSASKTIIKDGKKYYPKQDITTILLLGTDEFGPKESSGLYFNSCESDVVMLIVFNEAEENYDIICLNRDTMVEMPVIGLGGKRAGTAYQQLALAHTYGTGLEDSCENSKETISKLFNDIYIDHYASMNMDVISIVADAVDGVPVNITEDFSAVDPELVMGEMRLNGQQAVSYVRVRQNVEDQMNVSRMDRQKKFMEGFIGAAKAKKANGDSFIRNTYAAISPYMVTDISVNAASGMFSRYADFDLGQVIIPKGENVKGNKYMEFYLDQTAFEDMVLEIFYREK
ncbi:MAG: LCP family protein [Oscillospiraceae bacterium]|nr:LCP family protein [Oscillospiraceae bacterium]